VVETVDVGFTPSAPGLPENLIDKVVEFDVVVFLARLGDQLRFSEMPTGPRFVVCFANKTPLLASKFCTADYQAFVELKMAVDQHLLAADRIVVTCPSGTKVVGRLTDKSRPPRDTSSLRFPMSVFSPVPATGFSGKVALGGFLTGTGSNYYDKYTVEFTSQVFAHLEDGRLIGFSGARHDVEAANAHYDRIAKMFGLDRNFVHSWHAGIHPGCGFPWDMRNNYENWGGVAFGNPRILHFHTCGAYAPGEISWNLFDPTIEIDGVAVWQNGSFYPERLPTGSDILAQFPSAAAAFANPDRDIGIGDAD
ncbi:MAG: hypothetical protein ACR2O2_10710, partial [Ruegeria sp.]